MTTSTRPRIFVSVDFLRLCHLTPADVERLKDLPDSSIVVSPVFSFSAGGGIVRASRYALRQDGVSSVILVGMGDRYGAAAGEGAEVLELCTDGDQTRRPTAGECDDLIRELEGRLGVDVLLSHIRLLRHSL